MPAVTAFAVALAAGFAATWWLTRRLAPCRAERNGTWWHRAPWRAPMEPAAVQQPMPAATPVPAPQPLPPQPPPAAAGAPPRPPPPNLMGLPVPPHAGNVPQWRLDRAEAAGHGARDKLDGRAARVPKTPAGPRGSKTIFVVARAVRGGAGPGIVAGPWGGVRGYVTVEGGRGPAIHHDAVFHGFHSREEAECYWNAAFPGAPVTWLPPMP